jgi:hypothetical protein
MNWYLDKCYLCLEYLDLRYNEALLLSLMQQPGFNLSPGQFSG